MTNGINHQLAMRTTVAAIMAVLILLIGSCRAPDEMPPAPAPAAPEPTPAPSPVPAAVPSPTPAPRPLTVEYKIEQLRALAPEQIEIQDITVAANNEQVYGIDQPLTGQAISVHCHAHDRENTPARDALFEFQKVLSESDSFCEQMALDRMARLCFLVPGWDRIGPQTIEFNVTLYYLPRGQWERQRAYLRLDNPPEAADRTPDQNRDPVGYTLTRLTEIAPGWLTIMTAVVESATIKVNGREIRGLLLRATLLFQGRQNYPIQTMQEAVEEYIELLNHDGQFAQCVLREELPPHRLRLEIDPPQLDPAVITADLLIYLQP